MWVWPHSPTIKIEILPAQLTSSVYLDIQHKFNTYKISAHGRIYLLKIGGKVFRPGIAEIHVRNLNAKCRWI